LNFNKKFPNVFEKPLEIWNRNPKASGVDGLDGFWTTSIQMTSWKEDSQRNEGIMNGISMAIYRWRFLKNMFRHFHLAKLRLYK